MAAVLQPMLPYVQTWHCIDLTVPRGASAGQLQAQLEKLSVAVDVSIYRDMQQARAELEKQAKPVDQVVVFGSFYTVAEGLQRGV